MLRQVVGGTLAGVGILDTELRYVYVNETLAKQNGVPAEQHIGRYMRDVVPGLEAPYGVLRQVLADGEPREITTSSGGESDRGGRRRFWYVSYHRLEENGEVIGVAGIVIEVRTPRRQQELERIRERLALLDSATTRIGTTLEVDTTCRELAEFLVPVLADIVTVDVFPAERSDTAPLDADDQPTRLRRAALAAIPRLREDIRALGEPGDYLECRPGSQIPRCMAGDRPAVLNLATDAQPAGAAPDADRVAVYRDLGMHSAVVVPLTARGVPLGALTMGRAGDSPAFTEEDVVAAQDLAGRAAVSLDNARRYTREHGIALELQRALLSQPNTPHPGTEVAARYLPAGSSVLVGGDWYDTIRRPFGRTLLAMGDVMGHGIEAAVDMSTYRSMLRVVGSADLPPHRILRQLDTMISDADNSRPVTCLLALADPDRGKLSCARAGHLPPAILRAGGHTDLLDVPAGPPLGTGYGGYELVTVDWQPGDVLLLYTDGLVEHRGEDIDASLDRLRDLKLATDDDLDSLVDRVLAQLLPGAAEDDVAVLAARIDARRPDPAPEPAPEPPAAGADGLAPHPA
jgi:PAS domain S-box-containing protein